MNRNKAATKVATVIFTTMIVFAGLMFVGPERPVPVVHAQGASTALVVALCGVQAYPTNQNRAITMNMMGDLCTSGGGGGGTPGGGGTQYPSGMTVVTPIGTVALGRNPTNVLSPLPISATGNVLVEFPPARATGPTVTVQLAAAGVSQQALAANANRRGLLIQNPVDAAGQNVPVENVCINTSGGAAAMSGAAMNSFCLSPGGSIALPFSNAPVDVAAINFIAATVGHRIVAKEW